MCLNVIRVSIESENFVHVQNYVQKASQVPDLSEPVVLAKLGCAAGMAFHLSTSHLNLSRFCH